MVLQLKWLSSEIPYKQSKTISVGELEKWCIDQSMVTEDDNEPFVVSFKFIYNESESESESED